MVRRICLTLVLLILVVPSIAYGHAFAPSLLTAREMPDGTLSIAWKVSLDKQAPGAEDVGFTFLPACRLVGSPQVIQESKSIIQIFRAACEGGLETRKLKITNLSESQHTVMLRIERADGAIDATIMQGANDTYSFGEGQQAAENSTLGWKVRQYLKLGMEHILLGFDHLCFVLCLIILMWGETRRLIGVITSFTVAHSVTLSLAALGLVNIPGPPVETLIALSIVLLAAEILRPGSQRLQARSYVPVVFLFGLLHGLGFAGALSDIGLPKSDLLWALVSFNVGVELGQVAFILAVTAAVLVLSRLPLPKFDVRRVTAYGVGVIASFWFVERVVGFWS